MIDAVWLWQILPIHFEQLEERLLGDVLNLVDFIQVPAVILTDGIAWLVCRPVQRWGTIRITRARAH